MVKLYPEFYNDVFGPIMQPGSSSHMAAPCRAGFLCRSLLSCAPAAIRIELDDEGSFKGTFGQMHEDLGMLNGAYGRLPDDKDFFSIEETLKKEGISYCFDFCEMKESPHINSMKFILTGKDGREAFLVANSTGGGMVETVVVNGYLFSGKGDSFVLFIPDAKETLPKEEIIQRLSGLSGFLEGGSAKAQRPSDIPAGKTKRTADSFKTGRTLWISFSTMPEEGALCAILLTYGISFSDCFVLNPVLPVTTSADKKPQLFDTMTRWREIARKEGKTLDEVAVDYETAASGWSKEEVIRYMAEVVRPAMHRRTHAVYEEGLSAETTPFTELHYRYWENAQGKLPLDIGVINRSIKYVMAGQPEFRGVLNVPGPMGTGGGFCYGVLSAVAEEYGYGNEDLVKALFVAAGVGAIAYTRTNPTGEVTGCAGECGVCTAMAAAGLTHMLGGTPEMVENAASSALQASIGWPCDPIPGGGDIPCMNRVLFIASMGIIYSQWALAGVPALLPFHETVDVADRVGRGMSGDLLCTARGGHCAAPTAVRCASAFRAWREKK